MKTMNQFLLTATFLAALAFSNTTRAADEPLASPRAKANEIKRVSDSGSDVDLVHAKATQIASPRSLAARHPVVAGSARNDVDLAHAKGPFFSPRYLAIFGAKAGKFEIAPLK
ncbi:MAG: hypothetical protein HYY23_21555 [Verrucomicrobia bacterium]|nr:hypothetical protein [Verrucomicrobiota bacterium]